MFTDQEAKALAALRERVNRDPNLSIEGDGTFSRLSSIVAAQSEADDWYASRPQGEGPTLSPEQVATTSYVFDDPDGVLNDLPHGGLITGHLTFAQWDADGTMVLFGLMVDGAEYIVQPIDPEAEGDEEDDES